MIIIQPPLTADNAAVAAAQLATDRAAVTAAKAHVESGVQIIGAEAGTLVAASTSNITLTGGGGAGRFTLTEGGVGGKLTLGADITQITFAGTPGITELDIAAAQASGTLTLIDGPSQTTLTTVTCGSGFYSQLANVNLSAAALTEASVDAVLAAVVSGGATGGTITLDRSGGGTNATPSAAGWASYDAAVSAGLTVAVYGSHP